MELCANTQDNRLVMPSARSAMAARERERERENGGMSNKNKGRQKDACLPSLTHRGGGKGRGDRDGAEKNPLAYKGWDGVRHPILSRVVVAVAVG